MGNRKVFKKKSIDLSSKMKEKIVFSLLIVLLFLVFLPNLNAQSIGVFKQNSDIQLYQTCNNCTYCNFTTIKFPNGTEILSNVKTIKEDTYFYFNLLKGNTTSIGTYKYCYKCGNSAEVATGCIDFEVTPQGYELTTSQGIIYAVGGFFVFLLFLISLYFAIKLPWKNEISTDKGILYIEYKKYLKFAMSFVAYLTLMFFFFILKGMSYAFLRSNEIYGFFNITSNILLIGIAPVLIVSTVFVIFSVLTDKKITKCIERGIPIR